MKYKKMDVNDFEFLKKIVGSTNLKILDEIDEKFSHDHFKMYISMPEAYVLIQNKNQVQKIMNYAYEQTIPVTIRGAGSGLVGGSVPMEKGILLDMSAMNKIIELDKTNLTLTVEPGVTLNEIYEVVEKEGLFYAPDPGNKFATIGGNISTNAGGMRAIKYGTTREWVRGLEVVTPRGELLKFGGKVVKNSTGYALKDLIIGSEGTLAIIVEATLKLITIPKYTNSILVPFDSREKAISAAPRLIRDYVIPTALEFFEKQSVAYNDEFFGTSVDIKEATAYLLLSYDNNDLDILNRDIKHVQNLVKKEYGALDAIVTDTEAKRSEIWNIRGGFLLAIRASSDTIDECDVVLPRSNISAFFKYVREVSEKLNVRIPYFGHIGDGNLHVYLCKDQLTDLEWEEKSKEGFDRLYKKAYELGGLVSGEHGIGIAKKEYMHNILGPVQLELMRGIKKAFDPKNILNPDKII